MELLWSFNALGNHGNTERFCLGYDQIHLLPCLFFQFRAHH